jgi:hypothetical protein
LCIRRRAEAEHAARVLFEDRRKATPVDDEAA